MKKKSSKLISFALSLAMVITFMMPVNAYAGTAKKYVTREYALKQIEKLLGATTQAESVSADDIGKAGSSVYKTMSIAVNAGLVTPNSDNELNPKTKATYRYVSNALAKVLETDASSLCSKKSISKKLTKSSLSSFLSKKFPTTITSSKTTVKKGNAVINKPLTVSNKTVKGNLVIGDGVGTGEVTLDNVKVTGKLIVRGGGENSIILKGSSSVSQISVRQVNNNVSIKIKDDSKVQMIYINDGSNDVNIVGTVGTVNVVGKDLNVSLTGAKVENLNVTSDNVKVTVDKDSTVATATLAADGTSVTGEGKVDTVDVKANNTTVTVPTEKINVDEGISQPKTTDDSDSGKDNNQNQPSDNNNTNTDTNNNTSGNTGSDSSSSGSGSSSSGSGSGGGSSSSGSGDSGNTGSETTYTDDRFAAGYPQLKTDKSTGTLTVVYKLKDGVATADHPADIYNVITTGNYKLEADTEAVMHGHVGVTSDVYHPEYSASKYDYLEITDSEEHSLVYNFKDEGLTSQMGLSIYSVIDCNGVKSEKPTVVTLDPDTTQGTITNSIEAYSAYLNNAGDKIYLYLSGAVDTSTVSGSAIYFEVDKNDKEYSKVLKADAVTTDIDTMYDMYCIELTLSEPISLDGDVSLDDYKLSYTGDTINGVTGGSDTLEAFHGQWILKADSAEGYISDDGTYLYVYVPISTNMTNIKNNSSDFKYPYYKLSIGDKTLEYGQDFTPIFSTYDMMFYIHLSEAVSDKAEISITNSNGGSLYDAAGDETKGTISVSTLKKDGATGSIITGAEYNKSSNSLKIDLSDANISFYSNAGCNYKLEVDGKEYLIRGFGRISRYDETTQSYVETKYLKFTEDNLKHIPDLKNAKEIKVKYDPQPTGTNSREFGRLGFASGKPAEATEYINVTIQ